MALILIALRCVLVLVFLAAGIAKLSDHAGSLKALTGFGVPRALAAPLAWVLPIVELVVALSLVVTATAWWGAIGALGLLALFSLVIAYQLLRGKKPDCHCFGQLHSAPIGWSTLARNVALGGAAAFVAAAGPALVAAPADDVVRALVSPYVSLSISAVSLLALLAGGCLLLNLMRQNGRLLLRMDEIEARSVSHEGLSPVRVGLSPGAPAPYFEMTDLTGATYRLSDLIAFGKPVVLVFSAPNCQPCSDLLPDMARWHGDHGDSLTIALISQGTAEENRAKTAEHRLPHVYLLNDHETRRAYMAEGTPCAVVVQPDGTIGSFLAMGGQEIAALITELIATADNLPGLALGTPAPEFELPDLDGEKTSISQFRGKPVLLIFFNPGCGYCQQMLGDLARLPAHGDQTRPLPLVVAAGSAENNRRLFSERNVRCRVLLQGDTDVAAQYRINGTPMGYLIDGSGTIASEIAIGAQALFDLAAAPSAYAVTLGPAATRPGDCDCGKIEGECDCRRVAVPC